jgi:hypothetical protein
MNRLKPPPDNESLPLCGGSIEEGLLEQALEVREHNAQREKREKKEQQEKQEKDDLIENVKAKEAGAMAAAGAMTAASGLAETGLAQTSSHASVAKTDARTDAKTSMKSNYADLEGDSFSLYCPVNGMNLDSTYALNWANLDEISYGRAYTM